MAKKVSKAARPEKPDRDRPDKGDKAERGDKPEKNTKTGREDDGLEQDDVITCREVMLPEEKREEAARSAIQANPANRPLWEKILEFLSTILDRGNLNLVQEGMEDVVLEPGALAVLTTKYWGSGGVKLPTAFLESTPADLAKRILEHCNAWSAYCNVQFVPSSLASSMVRITRSGSGYWSYLGTDIKLIPAGQATMCLQNFTMNTSEAEFKRVVRHEAGHTLGFPHEHMRKEIINLLDRQKTIDYFRRTYGWSSQTTIQQVLTPLSDSSILHPEWSGADVDSIMCYQLPGSCTKSGEPIPGGLDLDESDKDYAARIYPPLVVPPPPPPPVSEAGAVVKLTGSVAEIWVEGKKVWPA